jgi:hypothetical protein
MDPYLEDEALWPAFQHALVMCLYQILLPGLVDRYRARVSQRHYQREQCPSTSGSGGEYQEDYMEIRQRPDGRLVTLLEVVSPANKTTAAGRAAYLDKRREGRDANANLVEIDLVLQGQPTLEYSRDGLPDWDYAVTVTRSTQPERYEVYTATLQKRLPRFRLPLAPDDRDTVLDLGTAFTRCYDQGGFAARTDYRLEPPVPLGEEDYRWLDETLRHQKLRAPPPSEEEVARVAFFMWQAEGCPHGRDKEHWRRAVEQLRRQARPR